MLWTIGILLLLAIVLYFLIQTPKFQTWATQKISSYLEKELHTKINIEGVNVKFPNKIVLDEVYIEDQEGHELLHLKSLKISDLDIDEEKNIHFDNLALIEPHFFLNIHRDSATTNMQFIIDYFKKYKNPNSTYSPTITCDNLLIENGIFLYNNYNKTDSLPQYRTDFNHLDVQKINLSAHSIYVHQDSINARINHLGLLEKSGFDITTIAGNFAMNKKNMLLHTAKIQTTNSSIVGELDLKYKEFKDFKKFNDKVRMNFDLQQSTIDSKDIAHFSSALKGLDKKILASGLITGKVKNIKGKNLDILIDKNTTFQGDIEMNGLPSIEETFISLHVKNLKTSKNALEKFPLPPFTGNKKISLPDNMSDLGLLTFRGNFTGFINDFVAYGTLNTKLGSIKSDIALKEGKSGYRYQGNITTYDFDVGSFYNIPNMGKVSSTVSLQGKGLQLKDIDAQIQGQIQSFTYNDYNYQNIEIDGNLKQSFFDGKLNIQDDNLFMDFEGKVDLTKKIPEFSFVAEVQNIDFVDLNFVDFEQYASLSAVITSNAKGNNLENLVGDILMKDISYCVLDKELTIDSIALHSEKNEGIRLVEVQSPLISGKLKGKYNFRNIKQSMEIIMAELIPSYNIVPDENHVKQNFELNIDVHNFDLIQDFFVERVSISPNTRLDMKVNEELHDFSLIATADSLNLYGIGFLGTTLDTRRQDSAIYFTLMNDDIIPYNKVHFKEFSLDGRTEKDTLFTALEWNTLEDHHRGEMAGRYVIRGIQNIDYYFERSYIAVYDDVWQFNEQASINMDSTEIKINNFGLNHLDEIMKINGLISEDPNNTLDIDFHNIALENINPFFGEDALKIFGKLDGSATLRDLYHEKLLLSDLDIFTFKLNEYLVGDLAINSRWDNSKKRIVAYGHLVENNRTPIDFNGYYTPKDKKNPLAMDVNINHLELGFLNEIIPSIVSDVNGSVSGAVKVGGKPQAPLLNGYLNFEETQVHVDYLNTTYSLKDQVGVFPDMFRLDNTQILDEDGNKGYLVGTILHDNFREWNFDLFLDITDKQQRQNGTENPGFLCLNTSEEDNSLYYGKAYGSGYVGVSGDVNNLEFDINLKSEKGTKIALPLGDNEDVSFGNFVQFVDRKQESKKKEKIDLKGISLKFDLEITPVAEFEIIFDEAIGDVIRGSGQGNVNMLIDTRGKFEMFGQVELLEGDYLFTLQNLIAKEFKVIPGGTIQWFGDPLEANINLQTIYKVSAPLYDLLGGIDESYKSRTEVNLIMNLSGNLLTPDIGFEIELPNVDEFTRSQVKAVLNSEDETSRQAFGLIALRRFFPPQEISIAGAGSNISEFAFNQLNNWLSQISDDFDLGLNYNSGDEISNQEIALAISTQLFNDKLSLSGNFGVSNGSDLNQNASSLIGDLRIEYKLGEDGQIRLVVYNKSNDFEITSANQNASTQGVGILYQEEFDTLDEFYEGFKKLFKRKEL